MSASARKSITDGNGAKECDELDKSCRSISKKKSSTQKAESKEKKKSHKRKCKEDGKEGGEDCCRDDDVVKDETTLQSSLGAEKVGVEDVKCASSEADNVKRDKNRVEEKLKKLVHILESSEDREEKLEALRLIAEIAETIPDIGTDSNECSLDVNDIPLPPPAPLEIPLPIDPPPSSVAKRDPCRGSRSDPPSTGAPKPAVTKTRLGVVTLHKNKTSVSSRLQVTRHSLNELMSVDRSNKSRQQAGKTPKVKRALKGTEGEATLSDARAESIGEGSSAAGVGGRKAEIQQRINAWKEELLRDMSRDVKRRKYNVDVLDLIGSASKNDESTPQSSVSLSTPTSGSALPKTNSSSCCPAKESLMAKYSRPVVGADGCKKYEYWPVEMIGHTLTEPSLSYGCNPLYFEFPPHVSSDKKNSTHAKSMEINLKSALHTAGKAESGDRRMERQKIHLASNHKIEKKQDLASAGTTGETSHRPRVNLTSGDTFDDDDVEGDPNVATWDTSSDEGSDPANDRKGQLPDPAELPAGRKGGRYAPPDPGQSSESRDASSDYSYRSRRSETSRSVSRSRSDSYSSPSSSSDSDSSAYSKRSSRRHSFRSYTRSSRYSSSSYSSYTSSDSYYSSRSRSSRRNRRRRRRRRKKRQQSRSSSRRSRSRDRFGRRISRSLTPVSRKRGRSDSKEMKRVTRNHKVSQVPAKKSTSPAKINKGLPASKIKVEAFKPQEVPYPRVSSYNVAPTLAPTSQAIPLPNESSTHDQPVAMPPSSKEKVTPFIGPTLPSGHPLSVTQDIPLPAEELPQEEKFQPIGPNDPLVFKTKVTNSSSSTVHSSGAEREAKGQPERCSTESFVIPPEQAERYRALRLQAERHARKVMGGLTEEDEAEEEEVSKLMAAAAAHAPVETSNQITDGGNPQQQLVEELYLEQMASLIAQHHQQQQHQQHQHQQHQQQHQLVVQAAQGPAIGRLVHLVSGQQNVVSNHQFISLVQVGNKVVPAVPQAGAPLILAHQNAATVLGSRTSSPATGSTLVQVPSEDALQARARIQQARIELAEKALSERQEWVQIIQFPQAQPQHQGLILTHQVHPQGLPIIHRPNVFLGAARKTPTLFQVPAGGQIISPTFIGAQQVMAAQPAQQMAVPVFLGAHGQVLVPKFIR